MDDETLRPERMEPTLLIEDGTLAAGFVILPKVLLYARNVSGDAKILYAILLGYAWQDDRCFPGYERLCRDMDVSENTVRKYMRELEQARLIRQRRRGQGLTNIYIIADLRTADFEDQDPQYVRDQSRNARGSRPAGTADYKETGTKKHYKDGRRTRKEADRAHHPDDYTGGRYGHRVEP